MFRRIFVILVRDLSILNGMTYSSSGDVAVRAAVDQIHLLSTATEPEATEDDESKQDDGNSEEKEDERAPPTNGFAIADTDTLVLYDWYLNELPEGILIEELPKPGILIAIVSSEGEHDPRGDGIAQISDPVAAPRRPTRSSACACATTWSARMPGSSRSRSSAMTCS